MKDVITRAQQLNELANQRLNSGEGFKEEKFVTVLLCDMMDR